VDTYTTMPPLLLGNSGKLSDHDKCTFIAGAGGMVGASCQVAAGLRMLRVSVIGWREMPDEKAAISIVEMESYDYLSVFETARFGHSRTSPHGFGWLDVL
jgi:hypothetical protein